MAHAKFSSLFFAINPSMYLKNLKKIHKYLLYNKMCVAQKLNWLKLMVLVLYHTINRQTYLKI